MESTNPGDGKPLSKAQKKKQKEKEKKAAEGTATIETSLDDNPA